MIENILTVSIEEQKFLILIKFNVLNFLCGSHFLINFIAKKLLPNSKPQGLLF